jgi:hypothetical protein
MVENQKGSSAWNWMLIAILIAAVIGHLIVAGVGGSSPAALPAPHKNFRT